MMTGLHPLTIFYWVDNRGGRGGDDFEMEGETIFMDSRIIKTDYNKSIKTAI